MMSMLYDLFQQARRAAAVDTESRADIDASSASPLRVSQLDLTPSGTQQPQENHGDDRSEGRTGHDMATDTSCTVSAHGHGSHGPDAGHSEPTETTSGS